MSLHKILIYNTIFTMHCLLLSLRLNPDEKRESVINVCHENPKGSWQSYCKDEIASFLSG